MTSKSCTACGQDKPSGEYYRHRRVCKTCYRKRVAVRYYGGDTSDARAYLMKHQEGCLICREPFVLDDPTSNDRPVIHHRHSCGSIIGLVRHSCNVCEGLLTPARAGRLAQFYAWEQWLIDTVADLSSGHIGDN